MSSFRIKSILLFSEQRESLGSTPIVSFQLSLRGGKQKNLKKCILIRKFSHVLERVRGRVHT